jgi:hypothetical protein
LLIEGGADTSVTLSCGALPRPPAHHGGADHLGSGRSAFSTAANRAVDEALLTPIHVHRLEDEVLIDCDLSAQRVPVWPARNKST